MLPCGAYVTLEHEWILVFRKGSKRNYKEEEKKVRRESSFFWEERNKWFSDVWEIKGVKQTINNSKTRERNASFPFEIPFRLINMYSQQGDTILDPFCGLGTTTVAAMLTGRNSIGVEIDVALRPLIQENVGEADIDAMNTFIYKRYKNHLMFVREREETGKEVKYENTNLKCKVMTSQEVDISFYYLDEIIQHHGDVLSYDCTYQTDVAITEFISKNKTSLFCK